MDMIFVLENIFISLCFLFAAYMVSSAAIVKVLKMFGYEKTYLGWIPGIRHYALGTVCTQSTGAVQGLIDTVSIPNACLQWGWMAVMAVYFIPYIGRIFGFALMIFYFGTVYSFIYSRLFGEDSMVTAMISAAIPAVFYVRILSFTGKNVLFSQDGDIYPETDSGREALPGNKAGNS